MKNAIVVEPGQRFGKLTVVSYAGNYKWNCACECGGASTPRAADLHYGRSKACGCGRTAIRVIRPLRVPRSACKHVSIMPEHRIWRTIKMRCYNPNIRNFYNYGGRGIEMCDRWRDDFLAFLADVGRKPGKGYSIDRIDNNGHYEPGNCRWATQMEQCNNKRTNRTITFNGETMTYAQWSRRLGFDKSLPERKIRKLLSGVGG